MKIHLSLLLLANLTCLLPLQAGEPAAKLPLAPAKDSAPAPKNIEGWGETVDPAGDCQFKVEGGKLTITVPGGAKPHDLSAELASTTAPRVLQPLSGDFVLQVKVEGEFQPSDESTQEGRTGYTGAGLVIFADAKNFVRIERASLSRGGQVHPYSNFEIRVNGELESMGTAGNISLDATQPLWLRLEKKGDTLLGALSQDGKQWNSGKPKELRAEAWKKSELMGGVAAISTSAQSFAPVYSELMVEKAGQPLKSEKESK